MVKPSISNHKVITQNGGNSKALVPGQRQPNGDIFLGEFWVDSDGEIWEEPTIEEILNANPKLVNSKR
jgi:hypothetical protein